MAEIIDGKKISKEIEKNLKALVKIAKTKYGKTPALAVILVGNDEASKIYVSKKEEIAKYLGFNSDLVRLPETITAEELSYKIEELNANCDINAVLLQLPLPKHLNSADFIEKISPLKDVDGFTPLNAGFLALGEPFVVPCTALGILKLLQAYNIEIEGKNAVIIGRSNIVGRPLARLLLGENATVTLAHSKTKSLKELCLTADILISATGHSKLIKKDMVKKGAVIVDVGISRGKDGKLQGDVDFDEVKDAASFITPVPGGVGPMTIAILMQNTYKLFCTQNNLDCEEI